VSFILAWKFRSTIYLVADTAVTVNQQVGDSTYTSFEERSISQPGKSVYEGALKLINLERAAIAVAGDSDLGLEIARTVKDALRQTGDPRQAFETAIISHTPFQSNRSCSLIIAFPNSPNPSLVSFNLNNDQRIIEHTEDCFLPIGSIPERCKDLSFQLETCSHQRFIINHLGF
jgi:hypothetical protein